MSNSNYISVAFYNIENLFDTTDDPHILDDDFTSDGALQWTEERYENKLFKISKAISKIGYEDVKRPPSIVGLAEVENKKVLNDLINYDGLKENNYDFVHHNSPDERGIDTALLYRKGDFEVLESASLTLMVYNLEKERDFTRDILYVRGNLHDEMVNIYVNNWTSLSACAEGPVYNQLIVATTLVLH